MKDKKEDSSADKNKSEDKNQMEQVMLEHSTKYQLLFKKYIDN